MGKALKPLGLTMNPEMLRKFGNADRNHDGVLQFAEWCELVAALQKQNQAQCSAHPTPSPHPHPRDLSDPL